MVRPATPRVAVVLLVSGLVLMVLACLACLAFLSGQPLGVQSLALGTGGGLIIATTAMLGEVRKLQAPGAGGTT